MGDKPKIQKKKKNTINLLEDNIGWKLADLRHGNDI